MRNFAISFTTAKPASRMENPMMGLKLRTFFVACLLCVLLAFAACNRGAVPASSSSSENSKPTALKRYSFKGKIVSIDSQSNSATIDGEDIAGFMSAMTMAYEIRPASDLQKLHAGDSITADVVVDNGGDVAKYWLENVKASTVANKP